MDIVMRPIGLIHSPFTGLHGIPIQASRSEAQGVVELYPEFEAGLTDIDGFSHIHLLYALHKSSGYSLTVKPFLDDHERGLFATRHPRRPNPLGMSIVRLISRQGSMLNVEGLDMLDHTPLLDIKPYLPEFDVRDNVRTGWYGTRSKP
jgi:tRNA-Thr(GGU) m(6)t(6)A37 methyltransferase TsaA